MLHRDYLLEMIEQFVTSVTRCLRDALLRHDRAAAEQAEQAVASLVDLDPAVAMQLAPDSLVTMMLLSGLGDSVAAYAAYTLGKLAIAYDAMGDAEAAALRRAQAEAVAEAFGCDADVAPDELAAFDAEVAAA